MKVFDMMNMESFSYGQREKNVFYQNNEFKTRIIDLKPEQAIPDCKMESYVIFYVIKGEVQVRVNNEEAVLKENHVLITEPALLSMKTITGAIIMGVQIKTEGH